MPNVTPGTILRLNRASVLGSRDYTFRGSGTSGVGGYSGGIRDVDGSGPYIDEKYFVCRVVVTGTEGEPMRVIMKTKRRQRKTKRVTNKGRFTVFRVVELRVRVQGEDEEG